MPSSDDAGPGRRVGEPHPPPELPPAPVAASADSRRSDPADGRGDPADGDRERDPTDPGPTVVLALGLYGSLVTAAGACLVALSAGVRDAATLYVLGGYGWLLGTALLAGLLSRYGVPGPFRPRALYPRRGWLLAAAAPVAFGGSYLVATGGVGPLAPAPSGAAALAAVGGAAAAIPGLALAVMGRNAVARALRERASHEWTGPRSPARVRQLRLLGVAIGVVVLLASAASLARGGPQLLGVLGVVVVLVGTADDELTVAVAPGGLVIDHGNGDYYGVVPWSTVSGVAHRDGELVFERRGVRPSLRFDAAAVEDPRAVVAAARRRTTARQ